MASSHDVICEHIVRPSQRYAAAAAVEEAGAAVAGTGLE